MKFKNWLGMNIDCLREGLKGLCNHEDSDLIADLNIEIEDLVMTRRMWALYDKKNFIRALDYELALLQRNDRITGQKEEEFAHALMIAKTAYRVFLKAA